MIIVADQPKRPNGLAKAKSRALVMLLDMRQAVPERRYNGYEIICCGNQGHYRPDGSCVHVDEFLARMKSDWYRVRTWFIPFGRCDAERQRATVPVKP